MSNTFYLKTVHHAALLSDDDCWSVIEETEESFMKWTDSCIGSFRFEAKIISFEYDFRSTDQEIYVIYENSADAFAHKLRWWRHDRQGSTS